MSPSFNRREALAGFGAASLGTVLAACESNDGSPTTVTTDRGARRTVLPKTNSPRPTPELFDASASCQVTPEGTEGPYYFDADKLRGDIREDRKGRRLRLALRVRDAKSCRPIENAVVDIWHCDALGIYSGFESASRNASGADALPSGGAQTGAAGAGGSVRSDDRTYLRGAQVTNGDGIVVFTTLYPGWYPGRTPHIHAKVHLDRKTVLTSQLFFADSFSKQVYRDPPYSTHTGQDTFNSNDTIFDEQLLLTLQEEGEGVLGIMTFAVER